MFLVVRWSIPNIPDHLVPNLRIPNHLVPNLVPKTKPRVRHLRVRQHLFRGVNRRVTAHAPAGTGALFLYKKSVSRS